MFVKQETGGRLFITDISKNYTLFDNIEKTSKLSGKDQTRFRKQQKTVSQKVAGIYLTTNPRLFQICGYQT